MNNSSPRTKRLSKEQWQSLVEEQQSSAMTQSNFCLTKGLSLATFSNWKRKLRRSDHPDADSQPEWVELPITSKPSPPKNWDIELELPGNVILRMRQ